MLILERKFETDFAFNIWYKRKTMDIKDKLREKQLPVHVAIIMDGNGRWAKQKGNMRIFGHKNGVKAVREVVEAAGEIGIKYLTLYAFSTENWTRPKAEVDALMTLLVTTINTEVGELIKNNVRLKQIGDMKSLPESVQKKLEEAIFKTSHCTGLTLVLALSYSGRSEITNAVAQMLVDAKEGKLTAENVTESLISSYLYTSEIPDPDLLIRTSGEYRISNFLLWQLAYSEMYFTGTLWPDFRKKDLFEAVLDYQQRERRFGKTGDQISS